MGNAESNPVKNLDKRAARRTYREAFARSIALYRRSERVALSHQEMVDDSDAARSGGRAASGNRRQIRVCVRKRPIFQDELDALEFDVVTCPPNNGRLVAVHDARMASDMKKQLMHHNEFVFDNVFSEAANNDDVYSGTVGPLVAEAVGGGFATCLMYGQTGSGKTYTMSAIYERAARDLFDAFGCAAAEVGGRTALAAGSVSVSFFELAGVQCSDLLNGFKPANLLTGTDGCVYPFPLVEASVSSAEDLMAMVRHGVQVRTTAATGVHDASSRSHAVLRIFVQRPHGVGGEDHHGGLYVNAGGATESEGVLTLVDLAGSEHRIDSMYHTRARRKEGAEINASLMALKSIVHARAAGRDVSHVYRKSKLTMALKSSFTHHRARTVVIATVSPAAKDTEHSLNTLRHACVMDGKGHIMGATGATFKGDRRAGGASGVTQAAGGSVRTVVVGEVDFGREARRLRDAHKKGCGESQQRAESSSGNYFEAEDEQSEAKRQKKLAAERRANERRAWAALTPAQREILQRERERLGRDPRQEARLRRPAATVPAPAPVRAPPPAPGTVSVTAVTSSSVSAPSLASPARAGATSLMQMRDARTRGGAHDPYESTAAADAMGEDQALAMALANSLADYERGPSRPPPRPHQSQSHSLPQPQVPAVLQPQPHAQAQRGSGASDVYQLVRQGYEDDTDQPTPTVDYDLAATAQLGRATPEIYGQGAAESDLATPSAACPGAHEGYTNENPYTAQNYYTNSSGTEPQSLPQHDEDAFRISEPTHVPGPVPAPEPVAVPRPAATTASSAVSAELRAERVRRAREQRIADETARRRAKLAGKEQKIAELAGSGSSSGVQADIDRLEAKLREAPSAASRYGIEKQLKAKRAVLVRERRQAEQKQRVAQAQARAAAEAQARAAKQREADEAAARAAEAQAAREAEAAARARKPVWDGRFG